MKNRNSNFKKDTPSEKRNAQAKPFAKREQNLSKNEANPKREARPSNKDTNRDTRFDKPKREGKLDSKFEPTEKRRRTDAPTQRKAAFQKNTNPKHADRNGEKSDKDFGKNDRKNFHPTDRPVDRFTDRREKGSRQQEGELSQRDALRLKAKTNPKAAQRSNFKPKSGAESDFEADKKTTKGSDFRKTTRFSERKQTERGERNRNQDENPKRRNFAKESRNTKSGRTKGVQTEEDTHFIRLNRYIANSGLCSRREADKLIAKGAISINGNVVTELGYKVSQKDVVQYRDKVLRKERNVYILLNKPKDTLTTTQDPQGRPTVMDLVREACLERIYPVGRLDRNTTGLLLLTNDGEMAKKLSHPSYGVQKIYRVELDKPFVDTDFQKLVEGITLEDGFIKPDGIAILTPDRKTIGVELHSGKNRIVRRMFSHLSYEVEKLDRTVYAGLTKETLSRGQWRYLSEREIIRLKFFTKRTIG
ncbi:pseudouridine synthase [Hugenholtzia roseola]|uniref:pseudouridine synthase n=1 Tax=Hugenholtzia roseola TaxID=1002 RepID=UPI0003F68E9D|nr:pseudouridine synthase [Hugenholtzia roseola]